MTKFKKRIKDDREMFPFGGKFTAEEMERVEKLKVGISHRELYLRLVDAELNGTVSNEWFSWNDEWFRREDFSKIGDVYISDGFWVLQTIFVGSRYLVKLCNGSTALETANELRKEFLREVIG